jgi:hypothetical protein
MNRRPWNEIIGPRNVNRGPWNAIMGPRNVNRCREYDYGTVECE